MTLQPHRVSFAKRVMSDKLYLISKHNVLINKKCNNQADFLVLRDSRNSTCLGLASTGLCVSRASRFSIIQRATMAVAECSTHKSIWPLSVLERFAALLSAASSKSSTSDCEESNRNSRGGSGITVLLLSFNNKLLTTRFNINSQTVPNVLVLGAA